MPEFTIRTIHEDEWRDLRALRLEALQDEPVAYGATYDESITWPEERWQLMAREWNYILAYDGDQPIGMGSGNFHDQHPGTTWLFGMYVTPTWRGKGVAEAIIFEVEKWALSHGSTELFLHVAEQLPRSQGLYRKVGFVTTGQRHGMQRDESITLLEMRKTLA